jgi:hypothetical protein
MWHLLVLAVVLLGVAAVEERVLGWVWGGEGQEQGEREEIKD